LLGDQEVAAGLGIPTYDFVKAAYASSYLSFSHKEVATVDGAPLETLTAFDQQWNNKYNPRGGTPFILLGGKYQQHSSGYSPELLYDKTFEQVSADVAARASVDYVAAIEREADIITAYVCTLTENQPDDVCRDGAIPALVAQIEQSL
jgi:hypothetical protein